MNVPHLVLGIESGLLQIPFGIVAVVGMFFLLVVPHEGGHFWAARLFGIRVDEFSVGMGPKIWSFTRGATLYAVRSIPFGGFVRLGGMEAGDLDDANGFHRKPAYQRLAVLVAGPVANFLMASLVLIAAVMLNLNDDPGKVVAVTSGSPAAVAGLHSGDSIRAVDSLPIQRPDDIRKAEDQKAGQPLDFTVRRASGRLEHLTIQPLLQDGGFKIGVSTAGLVTPRDAIDALAFPYTTARAMVSGLYDLVTGQIPGGFLGPQGATGVIGISKITYDAASRGPLDYWQVVAAISVALGLANLLPLPALDGGRILVVIAETLRRAPFNRERELAVQRYGLMGMIALIIVIAYFDVQRIASGQFPGVH